MESARNFPLDVLDVGIPLQVGLNDETQVSLALDSAQCFASQRYCQGKAPHSVITTVFVSLTVKCQVSNHVAALVTLDWSTRSAVAAEWLLAIKVVSSAKRLLRVAWELQAAGRSIVYTRNGSGPSSDLWGTPAGI